MGYDRHQAIVVTSYSREDIDHAYAVAVRTFDSMEDRMEYGCDMVTPIMMSPSNGWFTFFVGPDGGKESGPASAEGDARRAAFRAWLKSQAHEHGESRYAWVEVQYGDDSLETCIVDDSDAACRVALDT